MSNNITLYAGILGLVLLIIIVLIAYLSRRQKEKKVEETSLRYNKRLELDARYKSRFINYQNQYKLVCQVKKRNQVDGFDFWASLGKNLSMGRPVNIQSVKEQNRQNIALETDYLETLQQLPPFQSEEDLNKKNINIDFNKYHELECKILNIPLVTPVKGLWIKVVASYISPAGRSRYSDSRTFSLDECINAVESWNEAKAAEARRRNSANFERGKMSDKLRYEILKRDNFQCQICGATRADGAKLEVDHIIPIAKGGKTTKENLRTLCSRCNRGKSASYDPHGPN